MEEDKRLGNVAHIRVCLGPNVPFEGANQKIGDLLGKYTIRCRIALG
ncbi:MAG: hypothetical protein MUC98_05685 [Desulfobacterota bacterium]|nr:hypothetical protein [Thermodesulfobacteriota bacterium]